MAPRSLVATGSYNIVVTLHLQAAMRTTLRRLGNSRAVLIPATLLAECGITEAIDLRLEGRSIIIEPAKPQREAWFEHHSHESSAVTRPGVSPGPNGEDWEW